MLSRITTGVALVAALFLAVGFTVAMPPTTALADAPSFDVSPSNGLIGGQYVRGSWRNVAPGTIVSIRQCKVHPTSVKQCTAAARSQLRVDADGAGSVALPVDSPWTDPTPTGGPTKNSVPCDYRHPCSVGLFTDINATDVHSALFQTIRFEAPQDSCPSADVGATGIGGAPAFRAWVRWEGIACKPPTDANVEYVLKSSIEGKAAFAGGTSDYTVTDVPFTDDENAALKSAGTQYDYAPVTTSGLVFAYRMFDHEPNGVLGDQVTNLRLTPNLLAEIFTGQIPNGWNDPRILALNPNYDPNTHAGHGLPPNIRAVGRADECGQSLMLTSWFNAVAKGAWNAGGSVFGDPTTLFPSTGAVELWTGAQKEVTEMLTPSDNNDPYAYGWIGFMDSSTAAQYSLPTVQVQNAAGNWVDATAQTLAAGIAAMKEQADGTLWPDFATNSPTAYPMPVVSYMAAMQNVPSSGTFDGSAGKVLKSFLTYAATDGQKVLPPGYVPLTKPLVDQALSAAKGIPDDPSKVPDSGPGGGAGGTGGGTGTGAFSSTSPSPGLDGASPSPAAGAGSTTVKEFAQGGYPPGTLAATHSRFLLPIFMLLAFAALTIGILMTLLPERGRRKKLADGEESGGEE